MPEPAQTASVINSSTETMPPMRQLAEAPARMRGSSLKDCAWVRKIITPKKMLIVASVMMKLCTPERTTA